MAVKSTATPKCVFQRKPNASLACGYTRVRVMPDNYSKIITVTGITGRTIQDVVNELIEFALQNVEIQVDNNTRIPLSKLTGGNQK
nr:MAG TPA: CopG-like protein [Caudoviricetes sp.]